MAYKILRVKYSPYKRTKALTFYLAGLKPIAIEIKTSLKAALLYGVVACYIT